MANFLLCSLSLAFVAAAVFSVVVANNDKNSKDAKERLFNPLDFFNLFGGGGLPFIGNPGIGGGLPFIGNPGVGGGVGGGLPFFGGLPFGNLFGGGLPFGAGGGLPFGNILGDAGAGLPFIGNPAGGAGIGAGIGGGIGGGLPGLGIMTTFFQFMVSIMLYICICGSTGAARR